MRISEVTIVNYKCFYRKFSITFNDGINIIVGQNESGKSTILEAINLCLSGLINGRYLKNELSEYLFNRQIVNEYIDSLKGDNKSSPPEIHIEVLFEKDTFPNFLGTANYEKSNQSGVVLKIEFDEEYKSEYQNYIEAGKTIETIPIEYYKVSWYSCSREAVTARSIPIKPVLIDSTSPKYQNGSDIYISRIIKNDLTDREKVNLSQAFRNMKQYFISDDSVAKINKKINNNSGITYKTLEISTDLPTQNAWEYSLMTYIDEIPFHHIGKGEQCIVKTNLALSHKKTDEAHLILLEEPENHLTHSRLNELLKSIQEQCKGKQLIITTHSSFVANKLLLKNLILLNDQKITRLCDLPEDTYEFFKKLPGYPTLRLLLTARTVLVEGDSDELIFQRAYMDSNDGKLPIEDGIDVIAVKLTFKRFLDIAKMIGIKVAVITDNDGDYSNTIEEKYKDYKDIPNINVFADSNDSLNTLEPQFVNANIDNISSLCEIIEIDKEKYTTSDKLSEYMVKNKTKWALKIFESKIKVKYPNYIIQAVEWCSSE